MAQIVSQLKALSGVVAAGMAVTTVLVGSTIQPDYSHKINFISELNARGSLHPALVGYFGFIPTGLITLLFLWRLKNEIVLSVSAKIGLLCVAFLGFDWLVTALAPCDAGCVPSSGMSLSQSIHDWSGILTTVLVPLGIYLLIAPLSEAEFGLDVKVISVLTIVIILLSTSLMLSGDFGNFKGLIQRIDLGFQYSYLTWLSIKTFRRLPLRS